MVSPSRQPWLRGTTSTSTALRSGIRALLATTPDIRVVGAAASGPESVRCVVASGDIYVRPRVARMLAVSCRERAHPDVKHQRYAALSHREQAVVRLIAEGYNGPEIGRCLGISAKTVDTYKQRIEDELGLSHRTDYVRFAVDLDLYAVPFMECPAPEVGASPERSMR